MLKLKQGVSVQNHLLDFDKLLRGLKMTGAKVEEDDAITLLLLTLPEKFDGLCTALETMAFEKLSMEFVRNRLLEEESNRTLKNDCCEQEGNSESAFAGKRFEFKCYNCHNVGHKRSECEMKVPDDA